MTHANIEELKSIIDKLQEEFECIITKLQKQHEEEIKKLKEQLDFHIRYSNKLERKLHPITKDTKFIHLCKAKIKKQESEG